MSLNQSPTPATASSSLLAQNAPTLYDKYATTGSAPELGRIAAHSITFSLSSQAAKLVVRLVAMVVLARMIKPGDYGLFSLAFAVSSFGLIFKDGFALALIQRADVSRGARDSMFWFTLRLGLMSVALTALCAPLAALVYKSQTLCWLILVLCLMQFFEYLGTQHLALLRREMRFKELGAADPIAMTIAVAASIACAFAGAGVWSLVVLHVVFTICMCAIAWGLCRWWPRWTSRGHNIDSLLGYGKHLIVSDLSSFTTRNLDNMLIGLCCGTTVLGFYDRAYCWMLILLVQIMMPIGNVCHSTLSKLQHFPEQFRQYSLGMTTLASGVGMAAAAYLFVGADGLVALMLGPSWTESALLLKTLAPAAFFDAAATAPSTVLLSKGHTAQYMKLKALAGVLGVLAFFVGVHWGALGVAVAFSLSRLVVCGLAIWFCASSTALSARDIFGAAQTPLLASIGATVVCLSVLPHLPIAGALSVVASAGLFFSSLIFFWLLRRQDRDTLLSAARLVVTRIRPAQALL